jgi:hypothetical protein
VTNFLKKKKKTSRCTNPSNLFWKKTLHVSDNSSVHHQEFFTVHTAMLYVIQVCRQFASRIRMEHPDPARKLSVSWFYDQISRVFMFYFPNACWIHLIIDQKQLENVQYFNYLGSMITNNEKVQVKVNSGLHWQWHQSTTRKILPQTNWTSV